MQLIIIYLLLFGSIFGDQLSVLESYPAGHIDHFELYNDEYDIRVGDDGEILVLYTIIRDGFWRPHHFVKRYIEGVGGFETEIGEVGIHRERGNPRISDYGDNFLELHLQTFEDYYSSYELMRVDFDQPDSLHRQFVGRPITGQLRQTWRTDSNHASSFATSYAYQGGAISHQFLSNFQLYDAPWEEDTSYVMDPDTIFIVSNPGWTKQTKLVGSNIYGCLYGIEGSNGLNFVSMNNDSIISQFDSVLTEVPRKFDIIASENEFMVLYNYEDSNSIDFWSFNPFTGEVNQNTAYLPGPEHFEVIQHFVAAVSENTLYIELPSKQADTEPWVTNYTGLVRKQIAYPELNLLQTDTVITFDEYPEVLYHRLTAKNDDAHSLIALRTPAGSSLYYYGSLGPVGVKQFRKDGNKLSGHTITSIYPNPANPLTTITYHLYSPTITKIGIYSLTGQLVWETEMYQPTSGEYTLVWPGRNSSDQPVSSGIYFVQVSADQWRESRKIVVLK